MFYKCLIKIHLALPGTSRRSLPQGAFAGGGIFACPALKLSYPVTQKGRGPTQEVYGLNELSKGRPCPSAWLGCTIWGAVTLPDCWESCLEFVLSSEGSRPAAVVCPLRSGRAAPPLFWTVKPQNRGLWEVPDPTLASASRTYFRTCLGNDFLSTLNLFPIFQRQEKNLLLQGRRQQN